MAFFNKVTPQNKKLSLLPYVSTQFVTLSWQAVLLVILFSARQNLGRFFKTVKSAHCACDKP